MAQEICLIRMRCQREAMSSLLAFTEAIKKEVGIPSKGIYEKRIAYAFYSYAGSAKNAATFGRILENDIGRNAKPVNNSWKKSDYSLFWNNSARRFIVELVYTEDDDLTVVQYLILILQKIMNAHSNCTVLVSAGKGEATRYSPVESSEYFRLSHQLYFFAPFAFEPHSIIRNDLPNIYECFSVFLAPGLWSMLPKKYNKDLVFGRIIPQIPITKQSYKALQSAYSARSTDDWINGLQSLCRIYIERIDELISARQDTFAKYLESDSCFEVLLFISLCQYILKDGKSFKEMDFDSIHETCMDFAQGIMQLAENVVDHVLGKNGRDGAGILTIRYRKAADAKNIYLNDNTSIKTKYFVELYLTDLQYGAFQSIIEKFNSNVEDRRRRFSNEPARRLVHSKFYFSQNVEMFNTRRSEESEESQKLIEEYLQNTNCEKVTLGALFGEGTCQPFQDYISSPENMAFHYGLPILNSVVSSLQGCLYAESGDCDQFMNASSKVDYKRMERYPWCRGTAFAVYIPLIDHERVEAGDSFVAMPHDAMAKYKLIEIEKFNNVNSENQELEDIAGNTKKEIISRLDDLTVGNDCNKTIGVISCTKVIDSIPFGRLITYDVLAKAIFLYLSDESTKIDHLAIVNIPRKYDVIKLFRLFAVFFDRYGHNRLLNEEKSLFLVDNTGTIDILFYGNDLKSVQKNLSVSRLYGGTTEYAMLIIDKILEGRHE